jgi:hypothetical protein
MYLHRQVFQTAIYLLFFGSMVGTAMLAAFYAMNRTAHLLIPGVITWGLFFILLIDYLRNEYGFEDREEWIGLQHTRILDDLIDGVYSRGAGDGKDMAFGVWAILQRHARFSLPAPDCDQSGEEIYTTFSRLLVRIKGTSYLLLLAALKHVEGQPSWVPDWAAGDSHDWRGWGNAEIISRKTQISDNMFPASETARTVSLLHDSRGMGLSIRGRRLDTVIACSTFQPTKSSYDEGERQIHIDNITLLLCLQLTQASWEDFYVEMRDVVRKDHFMYWIHHSRGHRERRPAALLSSLLADHSGKHPIALYTGGGHFMLMISPRVTSSDILQAQIDMCNELARQKQAIFDASNIAWSSTYTAP